MMEHSIGIGMTMTFQAMIIKLTTQTVHIILALALARIFIVERRSVVAIIPRTPPKPLLAIAQQDLQCRICAGGMKAEGARWAC